MWKAWRRESQQRAPVDCLWRRLWAAQAAGIESQVLILVTHPSAPQATPIKSIRGRMIGFTQHSAIITPLHASVDGSWDFMNFFFPVFNRNDSFPQEWWHLCFVRLIDYKYPQPHTRGSVMHMQPRSFTQRATVHLCSLSNQVYLNKQSKTSNSQPAEFSNLILTFPPYKQIYMWKLTFVCRSAGFSEVCRGILTHSEGWSWAVLIYKSKNSTWRYNDVFKHLYVLYVW